jgi:hypothetical protein
LNKRTREEMRSVIWFMWVSNTRAMHISRHCGLVWCRCVICPTSVKLVSWLCKWSGVMDEVRRGCPSTSNMYINDDDEMVWADRCVSWKQLRAGPHPLITQCLGCLSMNAITEHAADGCHNICLTNRSSTDWLPH